MRQIKLFFTALTAIFLMSGILLAQDTTMTITNNGNVGIGTINPAAPLHVLGSDGSGIIYESEFGDRLFMYYSGEDGLVMDSWRPLDARRLPLIFQPIGGNVGIGTYTPSSKLDVNGSFGVTGNATIGGFSNFQSFTAAGTNGNFAFTPYFNPAGGTILLGVYTGTELFPLLRFVESTDSQGYVDIGQDGNGDFTVQSAAGGVMLSVGRTTGDLTANSINTGAEALKIISGVIDPNGNILSGSGYTVERLETGVYKITFTEPFSNFPSVTGTVVNFGYMQFIEISGGFNVTVGLREGSTLEFFDSNFSFTAIGGASSVPPAAAATILSADK